MDVDPFVDLRVGLKLNALHIRVVTVFPAPTDPDSDQDYFIAAITFDEHKAAMWLRGMKQWIPLGPHQQEGHVIQCYDTMPVMSEELEDVIFYSCPFVVAFFFLTSEEHLNVFMLDDDGDDHIDSELVGYLFC
jgi:hypothetical protein